MVSLSWCDPVRYIICVRIYTELKYCKINVLKLSLWAKFSLIITDPRALSHFTNWNQLIGHGFHQRDTWPVVIIYAEIDGFFVDMSNLLLGIVHITIHKSYPHVRRGVQMCWNLLYPIERSLFTTETIVLQVTKRQKWCVHYISC